MLERRKELEEFGDNVIKSARMELGARQKRKSYRARWKNGRPVAVKIRNRRYIPNDTGKLSDSLRYEIIELDGELKLKFYAEHYWYYVNFGRKKGKYPPKGTILKWIRRKPIRPQKGEGKGFARKTEQVLRSMSFLMNRKIKTFGIEGNSFFTKTIEIWSQDLPERLGKRMAKDILKSVDTWLYN